MSPLPVHNLVYIIRYEIGRAKDVEPVGQGNLCRFDLKTNSHIASYLRGSDPNQTQQFWILNSFYKTKIWKKKRWIWSVEWTNQVMSGFECCKLAPTLAPALARTLAPALARTLANLHGHLHRHLHGHLHRHLHGHLHTCTGFCTGPCTGLEYLWNLHLVNITTQDIPLRSLLDYAMEIRTSPTRTLASNYNFEDDRCSMVNPWAALLGCSMTKPS